MERGKLTRRRPEVGLLAEAPMIPLLLELEDMLGVLGFGSAGCLLGCCGRGARCVVCQVAVSW